MALEIERKFLVDGFPDAKPDTEISVEGSYVVSGTPEVRIRRMEILTGDWEGKVDYLMTIKGDGGLTRAEVNHYISEKTYHELLDSFHLPTYHKYYRIYHVDGHEIEVCHCDGGLNEDFYYAEVEFDNEDDAKAYVWPFGEAKDVTHNPYFKMKNFWRRTYAVDK